MPRYNVCGPRPVHGAAPGEQLVDAELTDSEESDLLDAGRIEIVPSRYRVVGPNAVHGTKPRGTFTRALTAGQERQLVDGGHIEPVPARSSAPTSTQPPAGGTKE